MKLYSMVPQDCSGKVRWLLLELGVPFEEERLSYRAGDLKTESYLAKHPIGQVPVLEDGTQTVYESYAIVAYLADKYIDRGLAPISAIDTCLGYALDAIVDEAFFKDFPRTKAYYERLSQRAACLESQIFKRS